MSTWPRFLYIVSLNLIQDELKGYLVEFKNRYVLQSVRGIIFGKGKEEKYYEEYKRVIKKVFKDIDTPVLYN